ncbi:MAG: hypothetical protein HQL28_07215, partial [Candidatus Omnitrophica bacterium]|nr:hypothetical protein [Candidatus Omnitrophota bacterium]
MAEKYNSRDILEMAIGAKARAVNMYMALARNSENYHVSKLFSKFAQEAQHGKMKLVKWLEKLPAGRQKEAYPGERAQFLRALVDENTYRVTEAERQALEKTISEEEALRAGINFKKDFMLFLHDIKRQAPPKDAKTI